MADHLDGLSFRTVAHKYGISIGTAFNKITTELEQLPHCADISRNYCSKYSQILLVDGKFLKVKGYAHKIPVIYGIDYLSHDIPTYKLAPSENYQVLLRFFQSLRLLNYPLQALVSDDNLNIPNACNLIYPKASWQLCLNHFKENIRISLQTRTDPTSQPFMYDLEYLFKTKRSEDDFNRIAHHIVSKYLHNDTYIAVLADIKRRKKNLMGYLNFKGTPRTNNLIESFNSHLNGRLKTIKGFESFKHADLWLNGYFIRRRLRVFTDCEGKFSSLNGECSLSFTLSNRDNLEKLQCM
ncbi:transposase, partial [Patescibacteria group bacterium]|nr:transposase [Patescibacteria group bacterium]